MILIILNFRYYLNTVSTFVAEIWTIIETRFEDCPALMLCLLAFEFVKCSDQCDCDHFKFQKLLLPEHKGQK